MAKASWVSCGPGQPECATAPQSCEYWGNFYGGRLGDLYPIYYGGPRPIGMGCPVRAGGGLLGIQVFPRCDTGAEAGMTPDAMSPTGCSLAVQQDPRDFGQPPANNRCASVRGDPMNVSAGTLFEQVIGYQSAGSDKLAFVRSYNSGDQIVTSLGVGWRSNSTVSCSAASARPRSWVRTVTRRRSTPSGALPFRRCATPRASDHRRRHHLDLHLARGRGRRLRLHQRPAALGDDAQRLPADARL